VVKPNCEGKVVEVDGVQYKLVALWGLSGFCGTTKKNRLTLYKKLIFFLNDDTESISTSIRYR
jgi:hypothetical protein